MSDSPAQPAAPAAPPKPLSKSARRQERAEEAARPRAEKAAALEKAAKDVEASEDSKRGEREEKERKEKVTSYEEVVEAAGREGAKEKGRARAWGDDDAGYSWASMVLRGELSLFASYLPSRKDLISLLAFLRY